MHQSRKTSMTECVFPGRPLSYQIFGECISSSPSMIDSILEDCLRAYRQMCRDERYFSDPEAFRPERFSSKVEGMKNTLQGLNGFSPDDPSSIVFGFGRR